MSFMSPAFFLLLLNALVLYHLVRAPGRKAVLLATSCLFIGYGNLLFLVVALTVGLSVYGAAILVERIREKRDSRWFYWGSVSVLVLCWMGFRHAHQLTGHPGLMFPLGMSFYTFQAIGYLTEVYWGEERAERRPMDFLLYMLLFMKLLSGPIERSARLLPQLRRLAPASYSTMAYGMRLVVVGLVKKLLLADQIAPYIDEVFHSMQAASGAQLLMACLLYPVELYADFSGYTDMAIGIGMLFGLRLSPNFAHPFASQTTAEFWRRWHISLSSWVRDYLFMPLSSLTRRWGQWGMAVSLLATFIALGVWHGAGWSFAIYGLIQGLVIVWELKTGRVRSRVKARIGTRLFATLSVICTYLIFAVSLVFFKAASLSDACYFLRHISLQTHTGWKEIDLGMSDHTCLVAGITLLLVLWYDYLMSKRNQHRRFVQLPACLRWMFYYLIAFALLAYGKFGTEEFIYLQF